MKKQVLMAIGVLSLAWIITVGFITISSPSTSLQNNQIDVTEFHSVGISLNAQVYIQQGKQCSLKIDASPEVLEEIETEVKDGKLVVKPKNGITNIKGDIVIHITAPDYRSISVAGSANVISDESMDLEDVSLKIAGSGSMNFNQLSTREVEVKIAGSGKIHLAGKGSEEMGISIAGSGDLDATGFMVGELNAKISGSGDCKVNVKNELSANIAGSGTIYYKGTPKVETSLAGSGKVKGME